MLDVFVLILLVAESLRHDRVPLDHLLSYLGTHIKFLRLVLKQFSRKYRLSCDWYSLNGASCFRFDAKDCIMSGCSNNCTAEDLLELGLIVSTVWVYIMSLHVLAIDGTSDSGICIPISIGMKGRLSEVSSDG